MRHAAELGGVESGGAGRLVPVEPGAGRGRFLRGRKGPAAGARRAAPSMRGASPQSKVPPAVRRGCFSVRRECFSGQVRAFFGQVMALCGLLGSDFDTGLL